MSFILLGILNSQAAAAAAAGWFGTITDASAVQIRADGGSDSDGNFYAAGIHASSPNKIFLVKFDSAGVLQWQRTIGSSATDAVNSTFVTPTGDFFLTGSTSVSGTSNAFLAKYNSSGVIQWQVRIGGATSLTSFGVTADSSGNPHIVVREASDPNKITAIKLNTSGVIQWQTTLTAFTSVPSKIVVDGNNELVISFGRLDSPNGVHVAKFGTGGALQWQRFIGESGTFVHGAGIGFDSSNNYYLSTDPRNASGFSSYGLTKLSNAGSSLFNTSYTDSLNSPARTIKTLSDGTSYLIGSLGTFAGVIVSDSSGNIVYQRQLKVSSTTTQGFANAISGDSLFLGGIVTSSPQKTFVSAFPLNGDGIGSYSVAGETVDYEASSAVQTAITPTTTTSSLSVSTGSYAINSTTLTDAVSTFTITIGELE